MKTVISISLLFFSLFSQLFAQNNIRPEHQRFFDDKYQLTNNLVQPDGKIIVAGQVENTAGIDIRIMRFWSDGSLDTAFGRMGTVDIVIEGTTDLVHDIALQADGKLVLVGQSSDFSTSNIMVIRIATDGNLDNSFGNNGIVTTKVGSLSMGNSVAIDADGNIVVAGLSKSGGYHATTLLRYLPNGSLDASFGKNGIATFAATQYDDQVNDLLIQNSGNILVLGAKNLLQFNKNGTFDKIHQTVNGGVALSGLEGDAFLLASTYFEDGKLGFQVARYLATGALDSSFGKKGLVRHPIHSDFDARLTSLSVQEDGCIVLGGQVETMEEEPNADIALLRCMADGSIDSDFGVAGLLVTEIREGDETLQSMTIHPNGSFILLEQAWSYELQGVFAILRLKDAALR